MNKPFHDNDIITNLRKCIMRVIEPTFLLNMTHNWKHVQIAILTKALLDFMENIHRPNGVVL
jgi:hypothetical protein